MAFHDNQVPSSPHSDMAFHDSQVPSSPHSDMAFQELHQAVQPHASHTQSITNIFNKVENVYVTNSSMATHANQQELHKRKCSVHRDRAVDFLCVLCKKDICRLCKMSEHEGHDTKSILLAAEEAKRHWLSVCSGRIKQHEQTVKAMMEESKMQMQDLREAEDRVKEKIDQGYDALLFKIMSYKSSTRLVERFERRLLWEQMQRETQGCFSPKTLTFEESMSLFRLRQSMFLDLINEQKEHQLTQLVAMKEEAISELTVCVENMEKELEVIGQMRDQMDVAIVNEEDDVNILNLHRQASMDFSAERLRNRLCKLFPAYRYSLHHESDEKHYPDECEDEKYDPDECEDEKCDPDECEDEKCDPDECEDEKCDPDECEDEKSDPDECEDEKCDPDECEDEKYDPDECEDEKYDPDECEDEKYDPDKCEDEKYDPDECEDEKYDPDECEDDHYSLHHESDEKYDPDECDDEQYDPDECEDSNILDIFWSDQKEKVENYIQGFLGRVSKKRSLARKGVEGLTVELKPAFRCSEDSQTVVKSICPCDDGMMVSFSAGPDETDGLTKTFDQDGNEICESGSELGTWTTISNEDDEECTYFLPDNSEWGPVCGKMRTSASLNSKYKKHYILKSYYGLNGYCFDLYFIYLTPKNVINKLFMVDFYPRRNILTTSAFDASGSGETFAMVNIILKNTHNAHGFRDGFRCDRQLHLLDRRHGDDEYYAYEPPTPDFSPTDVCFLDVNGQELLAIADMGTSSIHLACRCSESGKFIFARYLVEDHPLLSCPTALNTDTKRRLWVACKGGHLLVAEIFCERD